MCGTLAWEHFLYAVHVHEPWEGQPALGSPAGYSVARGCGRRVPSRRRLALLLPGPAAALVPPQWWLDGHAAGFVHSCEAEKSHQARSALKPGSVSGGRARGAVP